MAVVLCFCSSLSARHFSLNLSLSVSLCGASCSFTVLALSVPVGALQFPSEARVV